MKRMLILMAIFFVQATTAVVNAEEQDLTHDRVWQQSYALERQGKHAQAAAVLDPLLRSFPNNEFALMRRGWLEYLQGKHNESLRSYNQAITINAKSIEARLGQTLPLMAQKRWSEAESVARKVIELSAWDYTAHVRLLICEEAQKKWNDMARHAAEFSARYPGDATALVYLARAEAWQGNTKKAVAAYSQVLERAPVNAEASRYLQINNR